VDVAADVGDAGLSARPVTERFLRRRGRGERGDSSTYLGSPTAAAPSGLAAMQQTGSVVASVAFLML